MRLLTNVIVVVVVVNVVTLLKESIERKLLLSMIMYKCREATLFKENIEKLAKTHICAYFFFPIIDTFDTKFTLHMFGNKNNYEKIFVLLCAN